MIKMRRAHAAAARNSSSVAWRNPLHLQRASAGLDERNFEPETQLNEMSRLEQSMKNDVESPGSRSIAMELLIPLAVLVGWIILQIWVLPRFGVKT
jgi:hypothetical protein